eukprot:12790098-Alexandrium_andersonii.AAC.1
MSASLVGSEMCIRDRGSIARTSSRSRVGGDAPGRCWPPTRQDAIAQVPVSYTHLTLPTICSV